MKGHRSCLNGLQPQSLVNARVSVCTSATLVEQSQTVYRSHLLPTGHTTELVSTVNTDVIQ